MHKALVVVFRCWRSRLLDPLLKLHLVMCCARRDGFSLSTASTLLRMDGRGMPLGNGLMGAIGRLARVEHERIRA